MILLSSLYSEDDSFCVLISGCCYFCVFYLLYSLLIFIHSKISLMDCCVIANVSIITTYYSGDDNDVYCYDCYYYSCFHYVLQLSSQISQTAPTTAVGSGMTNTTPLTIIPPHYLITFPSSHPFPSHSPQSNSTTDSPSTTITSTF